MDLRSLSRTSVAERTTGHAAPARPIRVLVADNAPTRAGVRLALERSGFAVCAEASDAEAAVASAREEQPTLCLLGLDLPGGGLRATREITATLPQTSVVVFSASRSDSDFLDALRAGADGYLPKDIDPNRLPLALRAVAAGEAAVPRNLVRRLVEEIRTRRRTSLAMPRGVDLTARESEVLELLRQGLRTREIASRLFISPGTVRTHVAAVLRKLHVADRQDAIRLLERLERR
jgi:DNA-binding NarL/FixJ family response regulator